MTGVSGQRTLVVVPNWVGDTVMAIPALEALAASGHTVLALCRPHLEPLLVLSPAVSRVVRRCAADRETIREIARCGAEAAVLLPNSFRSAWLVHRAGVKRSWGYRGDFRRALLATAVPRPNRPGGAGKRHQVSDYDALLVAMGLAGVGTRTPRLAPGEELRAGAAEALQGAGVDPSQRPLIGLFAGAEFGPSKRWPARRFSELARRLAALEPEPRVLIVAGPGEEALAAESIAAEGGTGVAVLGPDLDLAELSALLQKLDLLVTNDSGPMHLAAAVGTRCVALFGPTDPRRTAPLGEGHRVLWTGRWCSPCFRRRCPLLHQRCLQEVSVEEVVAACKASLDCYSIS